MDQEVRGVTKRVPGFGTSAKGGGGGSGGCAAAWGEASSERRQRGRRKGMVVVGEGLRGGGGRTIWVWRCRWAKKRRIAPTAGRADREGR